MSRVLFLAFVIACSTERVEPLDGEGLARLASTWSGAFAEDRGDDGVADVATRYLDEVPALHAAQLAEYLSADVFTHNGMRLALAGAQNHREQYDAAFITLASVEPDAGITASRLAFMRSLDRAHIDERHGVLTEDVDKRSALIDEMIARQPATADEWTEMYRYQLGTALFRASRTREAADTLMPLVTSKTLGRDAITSALVLVVHSLRAEGDHEEAERFRALIDQPNLREPQASPPTPAVAPYAIADLCTNKVDPADGKTGQEWCTEQGYGSYYEEFRFNPWKISGPVQVTKAYVPQVLKTDSLDVDNCMGPPGSWVRDNHGIEVTHTDAVTTTSQHKFGIEAEINTAILKVLQITGTYEYTTGTSNSSSLSTKATYQHTLHVPGCNHMTSNWVVQGFKNAAVLVPVSRNVQYRYYCRGWFSWTEWSDWLTCGTETSKANGTSPDGHLTHVVKTFTTTSSVPCASKHSCCYTNAGSGSGSGSGSACQ